LHTTIDCDDDDYCSDDPIQDVGIAHVLSHKDYNHRTYSNDIALVKLAQAARLHQQNILPICLPFEATQELPLRLIVSGFGRTESAMYSPIMQKASVPVYDLDKCQKKYAANRYTITTNQFCAGAESELLFPLNIHNQHSTILADKTDACKGDSGSSVQALGKFEGRPRMLLYGVVSYGVESCGKLSHYPGVYTNVAKYLSWILDNLQE